MKYKNIASAIHNFGDSFVGGTNYVAGEYVIQDLHAIHLKGVDIEIDWKRGEFSPGKLATVRIRESVAQYTSQLNDHLKSQNVDAERLKSVKFFWPANNRKFMWALDDRDVKHKIYVHEFK